MSYSKTQEEVSEGGGVDLAANWRGADGAAMAYKKIRITKLPKTKGWQCQYKSKNKHHVALCTTVHHLSLFYEVD